MQQNRRTWLMKMSLAIAGLGLSGARAFASARRNFLQNNSTGFSKILTQKIQQMKLGVFSVSLNVKDLKASREFYENLGFSVANGSMEKNYLIMKNEETLIGLFHGMFDKTILTFNPGWDINANKLEQFEDVRDIQRTLKEKNIIPNPEADEKTTGPAYIMLMDPDGNQILIDQHV